MLLIFDGIGISQHLEGNAFRLANTPTFDMLSLHYPLSQLLACGQHVGLPEGQIGNSEVGHMNIGAGRIVYQELSRITKSIRDGDFFQNQVLNTACEKAQDSRLHLMGLVSSGGVHSHLEHLVALLELAKKNNVSQVFVHCFLDGRDTSPTSSLNDIPRLKSKMRSFSFGKKARI